MTVSGLQALGPSDLLQLRWPLTPGAVGDTRSSLIGWELCFSQSAHLFEIATSANYLRLLLFVIVCFVIHKQGLMVRACTGSPGGLLLPFMSHSKSSVFVIWKNRNKQCSDQHALTPSVQTSLIYYYWFHSYFESVFISTALNFCFHFSYIIFFVFGNYLFFISYFLVMYNISLTIYIYIYIHMSMSCICISVLVYFSASS